MKNKNVVVGMKVVPHDKTIYGPLNSSNAWKQAIENKQGFLYVVEFEPDRDRDAWVLSVNKNNSGDYFYSTDFSPFEKPEKNL
jgi:hypothetical protein